MDANFAHLIYWIGKFLGAENLTDPSHFMPVWDREQIGQSPEEIMAFFEAMKKPEADEE